MSQSREPWTREDIEDLNIMHSNGFRMRKMTSTLGRSEYSIRHAIRNMLLRRCLNEDPRDVAEQLGMDEATVKNFLAPKKYDLIKSDESGSEDEVDVDPYEFSDTDAELVHYAKDECMISFFRAIMTMASIITVLSVVALFINQM
jgi:hypothetical protein